MIGDTAAQDRPLPRRPARARRLAWAAAGVALLAAAVWAAPQLMRLFSADSSVSLARLVTAAVRAERRRRDAEGHAGDTVRKGQVLVTIESPELHARLAQETSNADAMRAEHLRTQVDARRTRAALQSAFDNARIDKAAAENNLARQLKAFDAGAVSGLQVEQARDTLAKAAIALAQATEGLSLREDSLKFDVQARQLAHARQLLLVQELQPRAVPWQPFIDGLVAQHRFVLQGGLPEEPGWFDPTQVEQALINLLKNAHEAGGPADGVTLTVQQTPNEQRIAVGDAGPGMSEAVLAQALLPFYSTKRSGTGLGLALAREIAEAHGGRIALVNRSGGGLKASLSLACPTSA